MKILLCTLLIFAGYQCYGTAVLVIETEDGSVILAADAKVIESGTDRTFSWCKIGKLDSDTYWSAASNFYISPSGFSVPALVESLDHNGPLESRVQRLVAKIKAPLAKEVEGIEKIDPGEYRNYLARTHTPLEIAFVGLEGKGPRWVIVRFYVYKNGKHLVVKAKSEPRTRPSGIYGIGFWGPAGEYLSSHRIGSLPMLRQEVTRALEHAADVDPHNGVGGPYSILLINKSGPSWVQEGDCPLK